MKFHLAAALALLASTALGCAEEEADARDPAYPVGYTVPRSESHGAAEEMPPAARAQAFAPAGPALEQTAAGEGEEVAVGADPEQAGAEFVDNDPSALTDFHGTLDPYGTWVDDASYGTVWVPSPTVVGPNFTPYVTAGRWAYDDDYVWVSDYDWGWAPFHYGRWVYGGGVGWEWIPGRRYAGAWVSWRWGLDDWSYVGWAPLPPTWCWHRGVAVGIGFVPVAPYAFVPSGELFTPGLHGRVISGPQVGVIAAHTRPWVPAAPSVVSVAGPARMAARPQVVGGPPPSVLRIGESAVVHGGSADRGVLQARAFARSPALAVAAQGAVAPRPPTSGVAGGGGAMAAGPFGGAGAAAPSHFGGRLGGGFAGSAPDRPVYNGGVYNGAAPRALSQAPAFPSTASRGNYAAPAPAPVFRGNIPAPTAAPAYRGNYSAPAPVFRANIPAPTVAPAFRGSYASPAPVFHGGSAAPAPQFHSGSVAPAFHASPGGFTGGAFHGGGGGGGGGRNGGHR